MEKKKEFVPKGKDEIRAEVIKEYDLDGDNADNQKFIDKLTSERLETQKTINTAVKQKINYRKAKDFYKGNFEKVGLDPKSGEPLKKEVNKEEVKEEFVTKEEFEKDKLRRQYNNLNDDEFEFVNAYAKGSGKEFKEALKTSVIKDYFETHESQARIDGATGNPTTRYKKSDNEDEKASKEFDRDLPVGFSSKKSN